MRSGRFEDCLWKEQMEYGHIWTSMDAPTTYSGCHAKDGSFTVSGGNLILLRGGLYEFRSVLTSPATCTLLVNGEASIASNDPQTKVEFSLSVPDGSIVAFGWTDVVPGEGRPPIVTQIRQRA